jgi:hypothetical protein
MNRSLRAFHAVSFLVLACGLAPQCLLAASAAIPAGHVVAMPPAEAVPAAEDLVPWPQAPYPRTAAGSVGDTRGWLLDAPAGKHGWVRPRPDGRLEFEDGTPARFWGTTLTYAGAFPDTDEDIERVADALAACGYNLVRFHHNDIPRVGLGYLRQKTDAEPASAIELDPEGIARLDRLAAACFKRGIYIHLDLVDSRPWTEDVGMPGWDELSKVGNHQGWKGVWPHPAMVEAWKRAATALLSHVNPHTGRAWGAEPGVAVVEALNENGPFWDWGFTVTDAVRAWHVADWNAWLLERHGDRDALAKRWTDALGRAGLHADEDPTQGTVFRPVLNPIQEWDRPNTSKSRGPCRVNDFHAYLADRTETTHRLMAEHIRSFGHRGLVIGSHELRGPINQLAEARATGMVAAHLYAQPRLAWGVRPGIKGITIDGVDVRSNNWYVNLPRIKVAGAPSWNGEWTGGSWTRRADVNLDVATAHAFQRVDGGAQFGFIQRWVGEKMPDFDWTYKYIHWRKAIHQAYSTGQDPTWTIANRFGAAMILRGDLPKSRYKVHIALSAEDVHEQNLHAAGINGGSGTVGGASLFLPLLHEVETAFFDRAYDGDADIVFSTGRSASGDYRAAKHAVVLGDNPWCDRYRQKRDLAAPARMLHPALRTQSLGATTFAVTWPYTAPRTLALESVEAALAIESLPPGATPIGRSEDGTWALGWCDDRFLVLPNAAVFGEAVADARWLYRLYLAAAERWKLGLENSADGTEYRSDNGVLTTDWGTGTQLVDSPRTQVVSGFAGYRAVNTTANMDVRVSRPYAVVALTATDGRPIAESKRLLLAALGRVANTGLEITAGKGGPELVKTGGKPTRVECLHGTVRLRGLADASLQVFALDAEGRRLGEVPVTRGTGELALPLTPRWRTIWFEVCAPGTEGPMAPAGTAWPSEATPSAPAETPPKTLPVADYLAMIGVPQRAAEPSSEPPSADGLTRLALTPVEEWKPYQAYGNLKVERVARDDGTAALRLLVGQHTKGWSAGSWWNVAPVGGLRPDDVAGFAFGFQGDGTMPRETYVTLKLKDGRTFRSGNLAKQFEDAAWREIVLRPGDFAGKNATDGAVDLAAIARIDFSCVGPLMDARHVAQLGAFQLLTRGVAEARVETLGGKLPPPAALSEPRLALPFVGDAAITADGDPSEDAWAHAVGFAMDEEAVPAWHRIGSHLAEGARKQGEGARFWLLGTKAGLALLADVTKGEDPPVAGRQNWYLGDCVEVFVDAKLERKKPTKQLFLAYRRPGVDRAAGSAPGVTVGRVRTARGYALEALIPWGELGFAGPPEGDFGLDLQVDVGDADGRRLQLTYATGTNEAWISAARFLTVVLVRDTTEAP